ncbi:MAG: hypothetical protein KGL39_37325 [Patescibacteria group bacterium]|nr:hypothetical protein [Patescibacteria group bacterium]
MWWFTIYGFFSTSVDKSGRVFIRARSRQHLENLKKRFGLDNRIQRTPDRDYLYRIDVSKAMWTGMAAQLANEQTWDSFKDAAKRGECDVAYVTALHKVWGIMHRYQYRVEPVRGEHQRGVIEIQRQLNILPRGKKK